MPAIRMTGPGNVRLGPGTLGQLPPEVTRPAYLPQAATIGVVHLGVGNFFRAHQAAYLDEAMNGGATGWGVCGISLRAPDTRDALAPQDGYYSLIERDGDVTRVRVIGALRQLLVAREDPGAVVALIAGEDTRWVTLTITEKGYGHDGRGLDPAHPDIAHDLLDPQRPRSAVGLIHAAVQERRRKGRSGLTILSCDNLSCNGDLLRLLLLDFDAALEGGSARWIQDHLAFPNTMVDRIVPRTDGPQRALARQLLGVTDAWPVVTEPFRQWVIEDRFVGPRPALERSGVQIVADVRPFEAMKLRLLNAAHSAIAWLAVPAGLATVDRAIADPSLRRFIETLWRDEIIPGLEPEVIGAAPSYCASLLTRFDNPGLAHQTAQIAMDGSQKLPLRVLPSIRANLARGLPIDQLALVVAAWIRYLAGRDEQGRAYRPDDPRIDQLQPIASLPDSAQATRTFLADPLIFGDLGANEGLVVAVERCLARLRTQGSRGTLS